MNDYDYERWFAQISADDDKMATNEYFAKLKWEMACCYRAIGKMKAHGEATGDTELLQDVQVLDYTVRLRVALDGGRLDRLPPLREKKIDAETYRAAWEKSKFGRISEIANNLDCDVSTVQRWLKANPAKKLPKKNRA